MKDPILRGVALIILSFFLACDSSGVKDAIEQGLNPPSRKPIDTTRMGVNAFVNEPAFGSISAQFREVKNTLALSYVRVLFNWSDGVQPTPGAALNLGFYDAISSALPSGIDALVVLTGLPSWMSNPANWIDGNPRKTFVENFVKPVLQRYAGNGRIIGFQIWNEPNTGGNPDNFIMDFVDNPTNFVELMALVYDYSKSISSKLILNGATTSIVQNFPDTVSYSSDLIDAGILDLVDVFAIHVYGKQYENYVLDGGVTDTLGRVTKPIWVTESGAQGVGAQLAYAEEVWPFLREKVPQVDRIYYYQFTESSPADVTYGLRNLTPGSELSDLYIFLRDR